MEVITAPPPRLPLPSDPQDPVPAPTPPPQPGFSAVRDVALSIGVPDLTKGRRPVVPPLARMSGASGHVEVRFSVDAAGQALVREASGPDLLKVAAEQTVGSWVFRRTSAERLFLVAVFDYKGDTVAASVKPES
jgi:outer membrane biosynthesis protein TonB